MIAKTFTALTVPELDDGTESLAITVITETIDVVPRIRRILNGHFDMRAGIRSKIRPLNVRQVRYVRAPAGATPEVALASYLRTLVLNDTGNKGLLTLQEVDGLVEYECEAVLEYVTWDVLFEDDLQKAAEITLHLSDVTPLEFA